MYRSGKNGTYFRLRAEYKASFEKTLAKFLEKNIEGMMKCDPARAHQNLKKLGNLPCDRASQGFQIVSHKEENLTDQESAERIAEFFSVISAEYEPLKLENLAAPTRRKIEDSTPADIPVLKESQVFSPLKSNK